MILIKVKHSLQRQFEKLQSKTVEPSINQIPRQQSFLIKIKINVISRHSIFRYYPLLFFYFFFIKTKNISYLMHNFQLKISIKKNQ